MGDTPEQHPAPSKPDTTEPKVTWRGIVDNPKDANSGILHQVRTYFKGGDGGGGNQGSGGVPDDFPDPYAGLRRRRHRMVGLGFGVLVLIGIIVSSFHIVPAGNVIVPQLFGRAQPAKPSGLQLTWPWPIETFATMSVQTKNYTMSAAVQKGTDPAVQVLGFDGASGKVDATVLYRLERRNAEKVFRDVGRNYLAAVIVPSSRNCIRAAYASVDLVVAATGDFPGISRQVLTCLKEKIEPMGLTVVDFQLRDLSLSSNIQKAVDLKVAADQSIAAAQHNADAIRQQAKGQTDAAQILACGGQLKTQMQDGKAVTVVVPNATPDCQTPPIDSNMLTYNYIQTLQAIINSPNSTVILPNGDSGQPIINVPATGNKSLAPTARTAPTVTTTTTAASPITIP